MSGFIDTRFRSKHRSDSVPLAGRGAIREPSFGSTPFSAGRGGGAPHRPDFARLIGPVVASSGRKPLASGGRDGNLPHATGSPCADDGRIPRPVWPGSRRGPCHRGGERAVAVLDPAPSWEDGAEHL